MTGALQEKEVCARLRGADFRVYLGSVLYEGEGLAPLLVCGLRRGRASLRMDFSGHFRLYTRGRLLGFSSCIPTSLGVCLFLVCRHRKRLLWTIDGRTLYCLVCLGFQEGKLRFLYDLKNWAMLKSCLYSRSRYFFSLSRKEPPPH